MIGYSLRCVDCAIVQAKYLSDQFAPYVPKSKIAVLYQAMDIVKFTDEHHTKVETGKILVMGHMTKAKGYTDILKIIPDISELYPHAKFYFAGNMRKGERGVFYNQYTGDKLHYEDPFEAEQKILNSEFKVNYINLGIISGDEKMSHLQTTDIFLTASYSEGFSRSLLEAMAMGKPAIYTKVGAHREVFKDRIHGNALVPGELEQLKSALSQMLKDESNRRFIGRTNRQHVVSRFSIQTIARDFENIISKTLAS